MARRQITDSESKALHDDPSGSRDLNEEEKTLARRGESLQGQGYGRDNTKKIKDYCAATGLVFSVVYGAVNSKSNARKMNADELTGKIAQDFENWCSRNTV